MSRSTWRRRAAALSVDKLGEEMYKGQSAPGGAGGAGARGPEASTDRGTAGGGKKDDDVIDAEYEVKE